MVCRAMKTNRPVVECNVRSLPGFEKKPYDCVGVVPRAIGGKSFRGITVDSSSSNTFKGEEATIHSILRPYAAITVFTIDDAED